MSESLERAPSEILVLTEPDATEATPDTYGRDPRGPRWTLLAVAGAVVLIALVGAIATALGGGGDETPAATSIPAADASDEAATANPSGHDGPTEDGPTEDGTGAFTTGPDALSQQFEEAELLPGAPLPPSVEPFEAPDGLVLVGLGRERRLAAVRPDGSVTEWLPDAGVRFFPLVSSPRALLGLMNIGGSTLSLAPDGRPSGILGDARDAPLYLPTVDGDGYVVHGTWLGQVDYIDLEGQPTGEGPALARRTRVLADTARGLVILALDGTALLIDRTDGSVIRRLDSAPLIVRGEHQVVLACSSGETCRAEIRDLDDQTTGLLDLDPVLAERLVAGMSPDGRHVAYLFQQQLRIVDVTGTQVTSFAISNLASVGWFDDTVVVGDDEGVQIWNPGDETPTRIELDGVIEPRERGLYVLDER